MRKWSQYINTLRCRQRVVSVRSRQPYSSNSFLESISVPCQSNGSITVDLHHPSHDSQEKNSSTSVLIYLPYGPFGHATERDASNISVLRSLLSCPIAQINYRLSKNHQYPMPVHDMLSGFDWIIDNLLPKRSISRVGRSDSVGKLAVCGEHIGGSLATALALTECRKDQPGIIASAISNPVVDWISLDNAPTNRLSKKMSKTSSSDSGLVIAELERLRRLRAELFRKPEGYFDQFASPMLFFRSAGAEVPPPPKDVPTDDMEQLSLLEREEHHRAEIGMNSSYDDMATTAVSLRNPTLRKASRRFPSKALGLRLPRFYISTGTTSPLREQAGELAHALRQSSVRQSKDARTGYSDFGRKVLMDDEMDEDERALTEQLMAEAAEKVELHVEEDFGGWGDEANGPSRLNEAAIWLRNRLE